MSDRLESGSAASARIKGWCPGALRPMESGDGLIVRLRISGGIVDTRLASEIACWSRRWGNGQIDLTNRANLQLRGLSVSGLSALYEAMAQWDLLDSNEAGEAVRNVISSPLAGLDPSAVLDVRPIAEALGRRLSGDDTLHGLPGKFNFAVDDGGLLGLDDVAADVRFKARRTVDGRVFDIQLAGAGNQWLGPCPAHAVPDVAAGLGRAFLALRKGQEVNLRRMRALVAACGTLAIADAAGLAGSHRRPAFGGDQLKTQRSHRPDTQNGQQPETRSGHRPETQNVHQLGIQSDQPETQSGQQPETRSGHQLATQSGHQFGLPSGDQPPTRSGPRAGIHARSAQSSGFLGVQPLGLSTFVGAGLPFGRIAAEDFAELASLAAANGARALRLTPWRAVLAVVPSISAAHAMLRALPPGRFIVDPGDNRTRIAACPGAPACPRGTTPVHHDAVRIAAEITGAPGSGIVVHLSGCDKGCAHPHAAPVTLVARNGRYHLVHNGTPSDAAEAQALTLEQAVGEVRQIVAAQSQGIPA